ncbi:hypothetical protein [Sphingomonas solaris]|uniref:DUF2946 domain-containing protein n=1 Tax=Alterirhizorhabdus solaris TaxID=2529389 RepID=A0A558R7V1_9SPHN|nr:hypothetical protein [Sphingomonas solaris]TVV75471.1 hypothetical protein FOY91_07020 [Sphingomonas solaris]
MRAILPLFASLMLMLTAWTVAAHAAERPVVASVASATADHDNPAGEDHALVHQHGGCHGHFLDIARAPAFPRGPVAGPRVAAAWQGSLLLSGVPPPHLRPPQA